jgi:anti-sigma B factor antagonist
VDFAVTWRSCADGIAIAVSGEVDVATAPVLESVLAAALDASTVVCLDLGRVSFMDAAGLGALVASHRRAAVRRAVLRTSDIPDRLARLLTLTGLADLFPDGGSQGS